MIDNFIPSEKVGEFEFGKNIENYICFYDHIHYPKDEITGWESYDIENPKTSIWTEDGLIVAIANYEELIYKGNNIIGMFINDFLSFYQVKHDGDIDELDYGENSNVPCFIYEFYDMGLQVWVKNNIILVVICSCDD